MDLGSLDEDGQIRLVSSRHCYELNCGESGNVGRDPVIPNVADSIPLPRYRGKMCAESKVAPDFCRRCASLGLNALHVIERQMSEKVHLVSYCDDPRPLLSLSQESQYKKALT